MNIPDLNLQVRLPPRSSATPPNSSSQLYPCKTIFSEIKTFKGTVSAISNDLICKAEDLVPVSCMETPPCKEQPSPKVLILSTQC